MPHLEQRLAQLREAVELRAARSVADHRQQEPQPGGEQLERGRRAVARADSDEERARGAHLDREQPAARRA
eukprot:2682783-Prymnesium_polylepis.1